MILAGVAERRGDEKIGGSNLCSRFTQHAFTYDQVICLEILKSCSTTNKFVSFNPWHED